MIMKKKKKKTVTLTLAQCVYYIIMRCALYKYTVRLRSPRKAMSYCVAFTHCGWVYRTTIKVFPFVSDSLQRSQVF